MTTAQKLALQQKSHNEPVDNSFVEASQQNVDDAQKNEKKKWAKEIYKKSVKRCHPDIIRSSDAEHVEEMTDIYQHITQYYDDDVYCMLMGFCLKVLVRPKLIQTEHVQILQNSCIEKTSKVDDVIKSDPFIWNSLTDDQKEVFLRNYLAQSGITISDKEVIKNIVKRQRPSRKVGTRPTNNLKNRVKKK